MASFCAAWCAEIRPRAYDVPRIILDISESFTYDSIYGVSDGSALIKRAPCCGCLTREMSIALAGIAEIVRRRAISAIPASAIDISRVRQPQQGARLISADPAETP